MCDGGLHCFPIITLVVWCFLHASDIVHLLREVHNCIAEQILLWLQPLQAGSVHFHLVGFAFGTMWVWTLLAVWDGTYFD